MKNFSPLITYKLLIKYEYSNVTLLKIFFPVQPLHLSEVKNCQKCDCATMVPQPESSYKSINDNDSTSCFNVSSID